MTLSLRIRIAAFFLALIIGGTIASVTVLVTWSASPLHGLLVRHLAGHTAFQHSFQWSLRCFSLGLALALLAYVTDLAHWTCQCLVFLSKASVAAALLAGLAFLIPMDPSLPLFLSILAMAGSIRCMRTHAFAACHDRLALQGCGAALLTLGGVLIFAWISWSNAVDDQEQFDAMLLSETSFVRGWSPCLLGIMCSGAAVVAWMRASLTTREIPYLEASTVPLPPELQMTTIIFTCATLCAWLAVSVEVESVFMSRMVMKIALCGFLAIIAYTVDWVGVDRAALLVEASPKLQQIRVMLDSDWLKGLLVLALVPVLPFVLLIDILHQAMRRSCRSFSNLPECSVGRRCITKETSRILEEVSAWAWASVLTKSMSLCVVLFSVQVGVSQGLVLFLAWFNELVEPWSFGAATSVLFVVEILLFLFPPVAGIPLYMIAGIVMIPKVRNAGYGFWSGVATGTVFCFFLKFVAIALEQKAIGEPFSGSVSVKKFIGVHTAFMKAVRYILSQRGLSLAKVAVLCGGPDWPTSVITGIMGLPLAEMLLGSVPVAVLIFPVIVCAAFKLEAGSLDNPSYQTIANISLAAGSFLQALASLAAAYYAQAVMDEFHEEFSKAGSSFQRDPQEEEILTELQHDLELERQWTLHTCWQVQPWAARLLLLLGTFFSSLTVCLVLNPMQKAFQDFTITDKVSELPGGKITSIILPPGWQAIYSFCAVLLCLTLYQTWCWVRFQCRSQQDGAEAIEMRQRPSA